MADEPAPAMLTVAGKRFACERCGANVFTPAGENFTCNGCGTEYGSGETVAAPADVTERRRQWRASLRGGSDA